MSDSFIVSTEQKAIDLALTGYDIWGTRAHVTMLHHIGVMDDDAFERVWEALNRIEQDVDSGDYDIDVSLGSQLTLEKKITDIAGIEAGGKVHTARSRNDQVVTAQRLHLRQIVLEIVSELSDIVETLLQNAEDHIHTVMPGYTHMQPAKPTTFGQWNIAYADMFLRDIERLQESWTRINKSPLGAAESYGTSWDIDRELTASFLGFDGVQEVPLDVIATRGESETEILSLLAFTNLHLSKIAQDLILLNMFEFRMIELGAKVAQRMGKVTGSSIMPQKKNPDVLEVIRANASIVFGQMFQAFEVLKALPFGYNRDSRETKELLFTGVKRTRNGLSQIKTVLETLGVNKERMLDAVKANYSLATDLADYLAQNYDIPYRIAYRISGRFSDVTIESGKHFDQMDVDLLRSIAKEEAGYDLSLTQTEYENVLDPVAALSRRTHVGGASEESMKAMLAKRRELVQSQRAWHDTKVQLIHDSRQGLARTAQEAIRQKG